MTIAASTSVAIIHTRLAISILLDDWDRDYADHVRTFTAKKTLYAMSFQATPKIATALYGNTQIAVIQNVAVPGHCDELFDSYLEKCSDGL